ncbi:hypothetical protein PI125_g20152 [Phytophthora idaei]|nr:hypothetical protein PI125_g20152 [Phytophthora idaei]
MFSTPQVRATSVHNAQTLNWCNLDANIGPSYIDDSPASCA